MNTFLTEREEALLKLGVLSMSFLSTKWYEFGKRKSILKEARLIADKWMVDIKQ